MQSADHDRSCRTMASTLHEHCLQHVSRITSIQSCQLPYRSVRKRCCQGVHASRKYSGPADGTISTRMRGCFRFRWVSDPSTFSPCLMARPDRSSLAGWQCACNHEINQELITLKTNRLSYWGFENTTCCLSVPTQL